MMFERVCYVDVVGVPVAEPHSGEVVTNTRGARGRAGRVAACKEG